MTSDESLNSDGTTQLYADAHPAGSTDTSTAASGEAPATSAGSKPQFTVKSKEAGYVGSGWMQDGKYGRYLSVAISQDVPKGARLYISPNKANAGLLG